MIQGLAPKIHQARFPNNLAPYILAILEKVLRRTE